MINSIEHQWDDLPKELLEKIRECIDSRVDILRFRSVCSSWRSSVSFPCCEEIPPLILKLSQPINIDAVLRKFIICRMDFIPQNTNSPSSSVSDQKGWLIKIEESTVGKLKFLHPVSGHRISLFPSMLNLLEFRFIQLSKSFMLKSQSNNDAFYLNKDGYSVYGISKVVVYPASANLKDELAILAIFHEGKLGYWKIGDQNWTLLDDTNFEYDDIIEYKGQFYVVDRRGTVFWIDSSLRLIQYSPFLFGCGGQKNLVESCGNLYVVDRYLDGERGTWKDYENVEAVPRRRRYRKCTPNTVKFKVYKLDEDWGKWEDVKSLDDRVFVLGIDCSFSVSAGDFVGGKGNCIYFTDDDDYWGRGLSSDSIRVFRLEDRVIEKVCVLPEYSKLFWKPNYVQISNLSAD